MDILLIIIVLGTAFIGRACRPGPVPKYRQTWFDIPR